MKIQNNEASAKYWDDVKKYFENLKTSDEGIKYSFEVFYGKIKTCNYIKMACKRHILFFYKFKTEKDFPYFMMKIMQNYLMLFLKNKLFLKHVKNIF